MREVRLEGAIDFPLVPQVCETIADLDRESALPIKLIIHSEGGFMVWLFSLLEVINSSRSPIYGLADGCANSAAFFLLHACARRSSYPDSEFMFHPPRIPANEDWNCHEDDILEDDESYQQLLTKLARCSGESVEVLAAWGREDRVFTAQEALELGFIDEIVERPRTRLKIPPLAI